MHAAWNLKKIIYLRLITQKKSYLVVIFNQAKVGFIEIVLIVGYDKDFLHLIAK